MDANYSRGVRVAADFGRIEGTALLLAPPSTLRKLLTPLYKRLNLIDNILSSGAITFVIGFTGCVGALRENTALLAAYAIFLAILLLLEMTAGILGFIFKDWIKGQATSGFQAFIVHYRDDPDQQNLIDWIQEGWVSSKVFSFYSLLYNNELSLYFCFLSIQLQCCGIEGPHDWDQNVYFNCSSASVGSREACGVPFSCCKPKVDELIKNVQCGYDVRRQDYVSFLIIICKKKHRKANLSSIKLLTTCFHEKTNSEFQEFLCKK